MSDWEYHCPFCEEPIRAWDFKAPKDWYRCFSCLKATPFHELPRRYILRTFAVTGPPTAAGGHASDIYLLESGAPDGYMLEDGSGVLLLE